MNDLNPVSTKLLDRLSPRTRNRLLKAAYKRAHPPVETEESDSLEAAYRKALGFALQYGIKVYEDGGIGAPAKTLADLRSEIKVYERKHQIKDGLFPPPVPMNSVIYCGTHAAHRPHSWTAKDKRYDCPGKAYPPS